MQEMNHRQTFPKHGLFRISLVLLLVLGLSSCNSSEDREPTPAHPWFGNYSCECHRVWYNWGGSGSDVSQRNFSLFAFPDMGDTLMFFSDQSMFTFIQQNAGQFIRPGAYPGFEYGYVWTDSLTFETYSHPGGSYFSSTTYSCDKLD